MEERKGVRRGSEGREERKGGGKEGRLEERKGGRKEGREEGKKEGREERRKEGGG